MNFGLIEVGVCAQAGGPKRGKTTFSHNLATLLAHVDAECAPSIVDGGRVKEKLW